MPDREKVISELESAASLAWNSNEGQCEIMDSDDALTVAHAIRDALELLKDQEPVKPFVGNYRKNSMGRCGHCNTPLLVLEGLRSSFCWMCGRMVKWDDSDRNGNG